MDRSAYAGMSAVEDRHWWFVARRTIIDRLIGTLALAPGARILEAGCGTGGNLALLARHGTLDAFEFDDEAREIAAAKQICPVQFGRLPDAVDAADHSYDLIAMLDVLEHLDDDTSSLEALAAFLAPRGRMLVTVPAMPSLWSAHDELHHHKRRYTRASLKNAAAEAGLRVERMGYFNTLLFPLAAASRLAARFSGRTESVDTVPPAPLNAFLKTIFSAEQHFIERIRFPVGLSLFAVLQPADSKPN